MAQDGYSVDPRDEMDWRRREQEEMVRRGGGVLNHLNHFDFVDRNHAHRAGDLRYSPFVGPGMGFTNPPMPPGQW